MGGGDERSPSKPSKSVSSTQETPVVTPSYADWTNSMQAYYGGGGAPPPFFAPMASPPPPPYMWGGQHPMMTPYGTPVPYPALYPPPGVYAHPNMSMTPVTMQANVDSEIKVTEVKDRSSAKKSRVTITENVTVNRITASGSGNDGATPSAESGSAGSSDGSEENNNNELSMNKRGSFEKMLADGASAQNGVTLVNSKTSVSGNPVSVPVTNLNMPMELWNPSGTAAAMNIRPTTTGVSPPVGIVNDQWVRDERDLKRQKRKQSNRESARRSRLRKQAECEELQQRVETLSSENHALRSELQRVSKECEKLTSDNHSLKEELTRVCGPEFVTKQEIGSGGGGGGGGESQGQLRE